MKLRDVLGIEIAGGLHAVGNFNPCFVLDLTATPKKESNIISYVDAVQLKNENMVKLPVIVYNRDSQTEVLTDAIDLRNKLEEIAVAEQKKTGRYIRPIALFQAQPKGKEDATTFEKLREKLVDAGIPTEQIAIRTADVNELKNVELMSPDCPVRYIITVNALKEGWDCPFVYILASLANKTSQVDVEQILGRILRLPHTVQHSQPALNMSYVLTSSNDFDETVRRIIRGLNSAGFSDKDYRLSTPVAPKPVVPHEPEQLEIQQPETPDEDSFNDVDGEAIGKELERRRAQGETPDVPQKAVNMLTEAEKAGQDYDEARNGAENDPYTNVLPWEVRDKVTTFYVHPQFREDVENLIIPQFFQVVPESLFTEGTLELLEKEQLAEGFTLKGKAYDIDFGSADDEIAKVDVRQSEGGLPKVFKMSSADQRYFKEYFNSLPPESRMRQCKDTDMIGGSLYQAEEDMNQLEQDLVMELTALPNVRWWHRNIAKHGFCINGFINHYPDIMLMTNSGKVIFVETKGEHLKNDDSRDKIALGQAWRNAAGSQFRYYMVFADGAEPLPGAVGMKQFMEIVREL